MPASPIRFITLYDPTRPPSKREIGVSRSAAGIRCSCRKVRCTHKAQALEQFRKVDARAAKRAAREALEGPEWKPC